MHENKNKIKEQNYKEAQTINKMVDSILKCPSKKEFMKKINPGRYTSPIVKSNLICNLNKLTKYKEKKKMDPFNDLKRHIMDDHLSIAEMSRISEIPSYKIRRLLSVNKKKVDESQYKRKLATRDKQFISDFFRSDYISFDLPDARYARKKYMRMSLSDAYEEFKNCNPPRFVGFSTFCKYRPEDVKTLDHTPVHTCCCELCENFRKITQNMIRAGFKGVKKNIRRAVEGSLCKMSTFPNGTKNEKYNQLPKKECSFRKCSECGIDKERQRITDLNQKMLKKDTLVDHERWIHPKTLLKEGKFGVINSKYNAANKGKEKVKSLMHYKTKVKPQELLDMYLKDLEKMGEHIFFQIWQLYMFLLCKVNLQDNQIIIVQDFARNFLLDCQNEPQSLHWDHDQVTLMPSVVYYNCPKKECDGLVTEEVIHITPDLKHDPHAVKYFTATTLAHVTSRGVNFNEVIEWTDQCPTHYKSKTVFYNMSKSKIKHTHHYFASRHGKNPADGTTGRTKTSYKGAKKSGEVFQSAKELYDYGQNNMLTGKGKTINGKCNHKRMCFKYVEEINREKMTHRI